MYDSRNQLLLRLLILTSSLELLVRLIERSDHLLRRESRLLHSASRRCNSCIAAGCRIGGCSGRRLSHVKRARSVSESVAVLECELYTAVAMHACRECDLWLCRLRRWGGWRGACGRVLQSPNLRPQRSERRVSCIARVGQLVEDEADLILRPAGRRLLLRWHLRHRLELRLLLHRLLLLLLLLRGRRRLLLLLRLSEELDERGNAAPECILIDIRLLRRRLSRGRGRGGRRSCIGGRRRSGVSGRRRGGGRLSSCRRRRRQLLSAQLRVAHASGGGGAHVQSRRVQNTDQ